MSFLKSLKGKNKKKKYTIEEYEVGELKPLPLLCKKMICSSGISPEEAQEDVEALICCLHFDVKGHPEELRQLKRCMAKYRRRGKSAENGKTTSSEDMADKKISGSKLKDTKSASSSQKDDGEEEDNDSERVSMNDSETQELAPVVSEQSKGKKSKKKKNKLIEEEEEEDSIVDSIDEEINNNNNNNNKTSKKSNSERKSKKKKDNNNNNTDSIEKDDDNNNNNNSNEKKRTSSVGAKPKNRGMKPSSSSPSSSSKKKKKGNSSIPPLSNGSSTGSGLQVQQNTKQLLENIPDDLFFTENPTPLFSNRHKIGRGAFGDVYTAKDKSVNTTVAIKILKKSFSQDSAHIVNEIEVLKSCNHPNIVNYLKSYLWEDKIWLVMEYCDGGTLNQLLSEVDLNEGQIANVASQVLKGLASLHQENRIHRDIKSDNILLNMNGGVKVADLGLVADQGEDEAKMSIAGSRYWMAPEMIRRKPYNTKVDIWGLGALTIEMAQRHPPYYGMRSLKAMYTVATKGGPQLKNTKKWSAEFKDFLDKCFTMDPESRPTAEELLEHTFIKDKASPTSKLVQAIGIVFLGNSLRMNGF